MISWPKLRTLLGVTRPVIADERLRGRQITLGAGEHGMAVALGADDTIRVLGAQTADVTDPQPAG